MKAATKITLATAGLGLGLFGLSFQSTTVGSAGAQNPLVGLPAPGTLGGPLEGLTLAQYQRWAVGRALFDKDLHEADGLGSPEYNADSCRACHQDGALGGAGGLELNVSRFGFDNGGVGPFQDLPGGQGLSKYHLPALLTREEYDGSTADVFEQRQTPALFGSGRIEQIAALTIVNGQDVNDSNGDGIYGVARVMVVNGQNQVGRFGWKGQIPLLKDFVRDAMAGECGITTPADGRGFGISTDGDGVADPELSQADLDDIEFFMANLAPPPRTNPSDPEVIQGELLFEQIGCDICHVPSLPDRFNEPVPLYSNLLLHNVMPAGFRGMAETGADVGYFQTPPLWGIRHSAPYMHDGRATTLLDAILAHEGEAAGVTAAFQALSQPDQDAVIAFLEDL